MTKPPEVPLPEVGEMYRIVVQGVIPDNWLDRLNGMSVVSNDELRPRPTCVLQGRIKDQAELNGVLETLFRLQVVIVSVEQTGREGDGS